MGNKICNDSNDQYYDQTEVYKKQQLRKKQFTNDYEIASIKNHQYDQFNSSVSTSTNKIFNEKQHLKTKNNVENFEFDVNQANDFQQNQINQHQKYIRELRDFQERFKQIQQIQLYYQQKRKNLMNQLYQVSMQEKEEIMQLQNKWYCLTSRENQEQNFILLSNEDKIKEYANDPNQFQGQFSQEQDEWESFYSYNFHEQDSFDRNLNNDQIQLRQNVFQVNPILINQWEQNINFEFTTENMKKFMDIRIEEGVSNDDGQWYLNIENQNMKVWTRWKGTEFNANLPCIKVEHYFPDIQEPQVIRLAYNEFRPEWDKKVEIIQELEEFRSENVIVHRIVNQSLLNMSCREFIDKKIFFTSESNENEEEIYIWVTSVPNELYPESNDYVRSDTLQGIVKIGKRKFPEKGCYMHVVLQSDIKVNSWMIKVALPLLPQNMQEWNSIFGKYLSENQIRLYNYYKGRSYL